MLDELVGVIETLKSRINEHRSVLQGSEAQTRLSLIDPLLRMLGWDTADPALVRPEYNLSGGRADYALLDPDKKPVAIIEAKKLNEQLGTMDHRMQMLTYANFSNVPYAGLTDGNQWVFYKVFDQKPLEERLVLDVSIADSQAYQCALQLLLLWRPNMASRQPIEASAPILGTEPATVSTQVSEPQPGGPTVARLIESLPQPLPTTPAAGWITLRNFHLEAGKKPPPVVRLPNGEGKPIATWKSLWLEVAEWLIRDGALTAERCPIPAGKNNTSHYVVNLQPRHAKGTDFFGPHRLSNGLYLTSTGSGQALFSRCRALLEHLDKDLDTVHLQDG